MAKFIDGAGVEHELRVRNIGHLEDVQAAHGIDLDTMFMEDIEGVMKFLYSAKRKFAAVLADLCGLDAAKAEAMRRSLDTGALERGRAALLEALTDFCLPPAMGAKAKEQIPAMLRSIGQSDGSNKDTKSADSSDSIHAPTV